MDKFKLKPIQVAIDKLTIVGDLLNITHAEEFESWLEAVGFERQERDSKNYGYGKVYRHTEVGYIEFAHQLNDGKTDHQRISDELTRIEKQLGLIAEHGELSYLPSMSELLEKEADLNEKLEECDERGYIKRIRDARYEFNPKYMNYGENVERNSMLIKEITSNMKNKDVTGIHIAQDYAVHLNTLRVVDYKSRRENKFFGKDKMLETHYFGSRSNRIQQLLYDKKKENDENGSIDQYTDVENVTRLETRIKGHNMVGMFLDGEVNPMKDVRVLGFLKNKVEQLDTDEQWMVEGMMRAIKAGNDPFAGLTHYKKNKYKQLLESVSRLKIDASHDWEKERSRIVGKLNDFLA